MGNTNQNFLTGLGQNMITDAASGALGIAMGAYNDKRQLKQQGKLQAQQIQGNKQMIDYQMAKQLEMWQNTSYGPQVEQMKKAGINPALLYGMSGGGGQTTGNASGSVGATTATQNPGEIGMGMQMALLQAQKENIEADTRNKEANTGNTTQDTELKKIQEGLLQIQDKIQGATQNQQIAMFNTQLRKATEELQLLTNQKIISDATRDTEIEKVKTQLAQIGIENELKKAQTEATQKGAQKTVEEIDKIRQEVKNMKDYYELDNFIEREKVRLMEKGINVALISSTLGAIMHFATAGIIKR